MAIGRFLGLNRPFRGSFRAIRRPLRLRKRRAGAPHEQTKGRELDLDDHNALWAEEVRNDADEEREPDDQAGDRTS